MALIMAHNCSVITVSQSESTRFSKPIKASVFSSAQLCMCSDELERKIIFADDSITPFSHLGARSMVSFIYGTYGCI